ncbi:MAG: UTP--glucose-1-phosphate uridylyltransferase GalU [Mycoplasmoidaceae bacterium]|nr:MAG: UTP--glucose-1-phosphate uridylyltransferase GalU [Mycoplasmoidaceae bacterium]
MTKKNNKVELVLLPCAGKGTRMAPITEIFAKEMLPINCKPLLFYQIDYLTQCGIKEFIFVISKEKENLRKYIEKYYKGKIKMNFVYQKTMNGTAKCVELSKGIIKNRNFLYINPDMISDSKEIYKNLIDSFDGCTVIHGFKIHDADVSKYGIFEFDKKTNMITKVLEKPLLTQTKSRIAGFLGVVCTKEVFDWIPSLTPKKGEYYFTEVFDSLSKLKRMKIYCSNVKIFDCGCKLGYAECNDYYTKKNI